MPLLKDRPPTTKKIRGGGGRSKPLFEPTDKIADSSSHFGGIIRVQKTSSTSHIISTGEHDDQKGNG